MLQETEQLFCLALGPGVIPSTPELAADEVRRQVTTMARTISWLGEPWAVGTGPMRTAERSMTPCWPRSQAGPGLSSVPAGSSGPGWY